MKVIFALFSLLQNVSIPEELRPMLEDAIKRNNIFTNGWRNMREVGLVSNFEKGVQSILASSSLAHEFALIGYFLMC